MKLLGDFLRDLALNCERVIQITIAYSTPLNVRVGARID